MGSFTENSRLGDMFVQYAQLFRLYSDYAAGYATAKQVINAERGKAFLAFVKDREERSLGATITSLLEAPVARVPRYMDVVGKLVGCTPREHPDYNALRAAGVEIGEAMRHIEQEERLAKDREQIRAIELLWDHTFVKPRRELIKEGMLSKVCRKGNKDYRFLLFSDALVYGQVKLSGKVKHHRTLALRDTRLAEEPDSAVVRNGFQIINPQKSFVLMTRTPAEKVTILDHA